MHSKLDHKAVQNPCQFVNEYLFWGWLVNNFITEVFFNCTFDTCMCTCTQLNMKMNAKLIFCL